MVAFLIIQALLFGAFCSFIAKEKNRDQAGWFFLGLLFSLIALLALMAVPKLDKSIQQERPAIQYSPPSPPIPTKTKVLRLLLIFLGVVLFIVVMMFLNR